MKKDKKTKPSTPKKSSKKAAELITPLVEEGSLFGSLMEENYLKIKSSPKSPKTSSTKKNS